MRFILGAKPGDHPLLFENLNKANNNGTSTTFAQSDRKSPEIMHSYCFLNDTPLNQANPDLKVNFLVYEEHNAKTGKIQRFSWVTDLPITEENAYILMRGGRSRWKMSSRPVTSDTKLSFRVFVAAWFPRRCRTRSTTHQLIPAPLRTDACAILRTRLLTQSFTARYEHTDLDTRLRQRIPLQHLIELLPV
jgi:hypothetical protein